MPSPLMLGMNLPDNDEWTLAALTNEEVLAIIQDALGHPARRVLRNSDHTEIWVRELENGAKALGVFNRGDAAAELELHENHLSPR